MSVFRTLQIAGICIIIFAGCSGNQSTKSDSTRSLSLNKNILTFTTWDNICYDRAASVWLIHHFVDSTAEFRFVEFGKKIDSGTPFDVPGAELGRQKNMSCFETILQKYQLGDSVLIQMARIVHDIDVNIWGNKMYSISDSLDIAFKKRRNEIEDEIELLSSTSADFDQLYKQIKSGRYVK